MTCSPVIQKNYRPESDHRWHRGHEGGRSNRTQRRDVAAGTRMLRYQRVYMYETVIPKSMKYAHTVAYEQRPAFLSKPGDRYISPYGELLHNLAAGDVICNVRNKKAYLPSC